MLQPPSIKKHSYKDFAVRKSAMVVGVPNEETDGFPKCFKAGLDGQLEGEFFSVSLLRILLRNEAGCFGVPERWCHGRPNSDRDGSTAQEDVVG